MENKETIENLKKYCLTVWHTLVCIWFYTDLILDLFTIYLYYKQSKFIYSFLTLVFTLPAILINTSIRLQEVDFGKKVLNKHKKSYRLIVFRDYLVNISQLYFLKE